MAIVVDVSPGSKAPPDKLGPYAMTPFGPDPRPLGMPVTSVIGARVEVSLIAPFSSPPTHTTIGTGDGQWGGWSHGYKGDVYWTGDWTARETSLVLLLSPSVFGLGFYVEPNGGTPNITATVQDGTSASAKVSADGGAQYYGFYATDGAAVSIIVVTCDGGDFAIGEFAASEYGHRSPRTRSGRRPKPPAKRPPP